jgi:hypothetical protein
MQIEWSEGAVSSCGRAVRQSAKDNPTRRRVGRSAKRMLTERVEKLLKGISSAAKCSGTERAETRDGFEFEKVVSCGSGDCRWRTKLYLGSCEPFDDHHLVHHTGGSAKDRRSNLWIPQIPSVTNAIEIGDVRKGTGSRRRPGSNNVTFDRKPLDGVFIMHR